MPHGFQAPHCYFLTIKRNMWSTVNVAWFGFQNKHAVQNTCVKSAARWHITSNIKQYLQILPAISVPLQLGTGSQQIAYHHFSDPNFKASCWAHHPSHHWHRRSHPRYHCRSFAGLRVSQVQMWSRKGDKFLWTSMSVCVWNWNTKNVSFGHWVLSWVDLLSLLSQRTNGSFCSLDFCANITYPGTCHFQCFYMACMNALRTFLQTIAHCRHTSTNRATMVPIQSMKMKACEKVPLLPTIPLCFSEPRPSAMSIRVHPQWLETWFLHVVFLLCLPQCGLYVKHQACIWNNFYNTITMNQTPNCTCASLKNTCTKSNGKIKPFCLSWQLMQSYVTIQFVIKTMYDTMQVQQSVTSLPPPAENTWATKPNTEATAWKNKRLTRVAKPCNW